MEDDEQNREGEEIGQYVETFEREEERQRTWMNMFSQDTS